MDINKKYTAIASSLSMVFLYDLFWLIKTVLNVPGNLLTNSSFLVGYIPLALGITGLIIFVISGFVNSTVLRMYMCFPVIFTPLHIWYYIGLAQGTFHPTHDWSFYAGFIVSLILIMTCYAGLWILSKDRIAKFDQVVIGSETILEFTTAPIAKRVATWLIDLLVICDLIYIVFQRIYWSGYNSHLNRFNDPIEIDMIGIAVILFYYLLLEGLFKTTVGKAATSTIIIDTNGDKPSFAKIIGRSLCRFIPFDAFSFLGASQRGWHDSIPGTYVVKAIYRSEDVIPSNDNEVIV